MNEQLIEAIRQLHLKPGETYAVVVDGSRIEIRKKDTIEPEVYEGQVMMMPWFDSPRRPIGTIKAKRGKLSPPDPVEVPPADEEGA